MSIQGRAIWKYCYWLDEGALAQLKQQMEARGITMLRAEKNPCEALRDELGYAEPPTWGIICKHDAEPWYRASKHAGKHLVVSSFPLSEEYNPSLETTIEKTTFIPEHYPSSAALQQLAGDKVYRSRNLKGWGAFPKKTGEAIVKGLGKMSGKPLDTFEDLLSIWNAVHSNFVNPHYRAGGDFSDAPYSVADSIHIGTCCVELFNLLDAKENAMLVRPCIGSVIVKVLDKDHYYLVRIKGR